MEWSAKRIQASFPWSLSPLQCRCRCWCLTTETRGCFQEEHQYFRNVCGIDSRPLQVNASPVAEIVEIRPVGSNAKAGGMRVQFSVRFLAEA